MIRKSLHLSIPCLGALGLLLAPAVVHAQEPAPAAAVAPAETPPPPPPPPAPMPAALPPPPVVTDTDAMAATRADKLPPIDVGAWTRVSGRFQGDNPKKL